MPWPYVTYYTPATQYVYYPSASTVYVPGHSSGIQVWPSSVQVGAASTAFLLQQQPQTWMLQYPAWERPYWGMNPAVMLPKGSGVPPGNVDTAAAATAQRTLPASTPAEPLPDTMAGAVPDTVPAAPDPRPISPETIPQATPGVVSSESSITASVTPSVASSVVPPSPPPEDVHADFCPLAREYQLVHLDDHDPRLLRCTTSRWGHEPPLERPLRVLISPRPTGLSLQFEMHLALLHRFFFKSHLRVEAAAAAAAAVPDGVDNTETANAYGCVLCAEQGERVHFQNTEQYARHVGTQHFSTGCGTIPRDIRLWAINVVDDSGDSGEDQDSSE